MIKEIKDVPMMALTATATPKVQQDIQKNLQMGDALVYKSSFNRTNLYYEIRPKKDVAKEIRSHQHLPSSAPQSMFFEEK